MTLPCGMPSNSLSDHWRAVECGFSLPSFIPVSNTPRAFWLRWAAVLVTESGDRPLWAVFVWPSSQNPRSLHGKCPFLVPPVVIVLGWCFFISSNLNFLMGKYQMKFSLINV